MGGGTGGTQAIACSIMNAFTRCASAGSGVLR